MEFRFPYDGGPPEQADGCGGGDCDSGPVDQEVDLGTPTPECGSTIGRFCTGFRQCNDGCLCNGVEQCNGGICAPAPFARCDDQISCTRDECSEADGSCRNTPVQARCDDGDPCDGIEQCIVGVGCQPGIPLACSDGEPCTIDRCDPRGGCIHELRDLDGDGAVPRVCGGDDCNDDPIGGRFVNPDASEQCFDRIDNDCDGAVDIVDIDDCPAANGRCSSALSIDRSGTIQFSSHGLDDRHSLSCETGSGHLDALFRFEVLSPRNLRASVNAPGTLLELRPFSTCHDDDADALACAAASAPGPNARAEVTAVGLVPGSYMLIASVPREELWELSFELTSPTPPPTHDLCNLATPTILSSGPTRPVMNAFEGLSDDYLGPTCGKTPGDAIDAAYRLTLANRQDVRIQAEGIATSGEVRDVRYSLVESCTAQPGPGRCAAGDGSEITVFNLAAGEYWVLIEPDDGDVSRFQLEVETTTPAAPPAEDLCNSAEDITSSSVTTEVGRLSLNGGLGTCGGTTARYVDAFYRFLVPTRSTVSITTSGQFHLAALYETCARLTTEIACVSSTAGTGTSTITEILDPGWYDLGVAIPTRTGTITASVRMGP